MLDDEREVAAGPFFLQGIDEQQTHTLNTLAHIGQLLFPDSTQCIVAENRRHHRRTVRRRVGVVRTNRRLHLSEGAVNGLGICRNQRAGTHAFVVQAKVLRVGARNQQLFMQRNERAQTFGIFFQTTGKALVGEVEQRQPAFFNGQLRQLLPLLQRRIDTGWVMAAAMEQNHVTRLGFIEACQHTVEVEGMVGRIVIGIFANFQTCGIKDAFVVRPARVAYPDAFYCGVLRQEVSGNAQGAGAARGLGGTCALIADDGASFTEQQFLGAATKFRNTVDTQIVFCGFIFQQILFCFFNAGQDRGFTRFIFVNTNPEVNFSRAVIGTKQIGQS